MRLAYLATHPIQYQAPLFRALNRQLGRNFVALFCQDHGVRPSYDSGFDKTIQFDVPLLDGYKYRFLKNVAPRPGRSPLGRINPEVLPILALHEFDALIVHGYAFATSIMCFSAPRLQTRVLLRGESNLLIATSSAKSTLSTAVSPVKHLAKDFFRRSLFRRVDHFLSIGTLNTAYYKSHGVAEKRITLAPYSVDNDFFRELSAASRRDPIAARRRLGLPAREILFVFAAKLLPKKRPFDLLDAYVRADISDRAGLVYIGDGELREGLNARITSAALNESVRFLGFRNQSELPEILGACDVLVLPSDFEPWGLAVNEAMACGAAAIVSDQVGAGPDLVGDDRSIFRTGDVAHLARMLRRFVVDRGLLCELKASASKHIAGWGVEQTVDGVLRGVETALKCG